VYYNVPIDYSLSIEVAADQSSVSFTPTCLSNLTDLTTTNAFQDPIYPTIAYAGTNGFLTTAGKRGKITKGDFISATDATDGTFGAYGTGGVGMPYNGVQYGKGGNGGSTGEPGTGGFVLINLKPI
jgi:hypothetical protein